jgi:hypothetical protein
LKTLQARWTCSTNKNQKQTALMLEHACESGHRKTPALRAQQKRSHMKEISQSIIKSTKSLLGRLTTVTSLGCLLALVFLGATSAQPKALGTARPFKASGIVTEFILNPDYSGNLEIVGTATHLGKFVSTGEYVLNGDFTTLHVWGSFTAANGDIVYLDYPAWLGVSGVAYFKGGTGRFAHASGSFVGTIVDGIYTAEGTISY